MQNLQGKNAIITGGSRGIGFHTALNLADEGVNVAIMGRDEKALEEAKSEIAKTGVEVIAISADVSNEAGVQSAVEEANETFDSIDILINNAGLMDNGPFLESNTEDFEKMMQVNVFGMYHMLKAVLPGMVEQKSGDVVNIASVSGLRSGPGGSLYSATKFAVIGMTEGLLKEMRPHNVRVSYLTPSAVNTSLIGNTKLDEATMTQPEDIADIIVNNLKIHPRTLVKNTEMWATNPQEK
ncbi:SDR family NAD(P)-dependent oxidoreductase [Lacicoccus alkaliphilus]|uniref:3-oxoacyl-[acyl-carrier protein] reductase n=1 Tax=Lacicoccus alkaliphilus DSM 16010 TaxID=1123231 RepID=A0A1M7EKS0_9BACL|nr:SDR family NAD(P)-dependent oxidoreductase [Salinicoccus alkaliphilus]SHL92294.1 3-oxoacyl-[acyl-carrier protein] reductase [Salinicoccus alkaliphilus DSM 16010]